VFVDRDGTLNPDLHYLKDPSLLELNRGVAASLRLAHDHGFLIVCVTNQSGIERGFYSVDDVERIHRRLNELLGMHGARVDAFYYCPHTPEHGCTCRKPGTALFEQAQNDWKIDFATSAVVGDRSLDILAGKRIGLATAVVRPRGHEIEVDAELLRDQAAPDIISDSFRGAVLRVLARG